MPDLDAALASRHPDRFRKHSVMMAVAGVAVRDGRILLVRDSHGFWAGVGGWIDPGETPEQAIVREAKEELGVEARVIRVHRPFIAWNVPNSSDGSSFLLFNYGSSWPRRTSCCRPRRSAKHAGSAPTNGRTCSCCPTSALFDERIGEWPGGPL